VADDPIKAVIDTLNPFQPGRDDIDNVPPFPRFLGVCELCPRCFSYGSAFLRLSRACSRRRAGPGPFGPKGSPSDCPLAPLAGGGGEAKEVGQARERLATAATDSTMCHSKHQGVAR